MKKKPYHYSAIILLLMGAMFVAVLSLPFSSSAEQHGEANVFESIQRQLNEILAVVKRIQVRIVELLVEEAAVQNQTAEPVVEAPMVSDLQETETTTTTAATSGPVWQFMPVPTTFLGSGLMILYRFSITAGSSDATIPSVSYTVTYADISVKDLEVHVFKDDLFSQKAYEINPVGKRRGITQNGISLSVDISDKTTSLVIPAGETRYFELQGITSGKNVSAFVTVAGEGMQEVQFK